MSARVGELRELYNRAIERDKPADAVKVLVELERLERDEPLWSHRLGEAYRRTGKMHDAEEAFVRAMDRYVSRGFLPRGIAMAKLVASLNPARANLVDRLVPKVAPPVKSLPPPLPAPLHRAADESHDEVRFVDSPESSSIVILLEDVSEVERAELLELEEVAESSSIERLPEPREPSIDRMATMAGFRLFSELSRSALVDLTEVAELVEFVPGAMIMMRDEPAFALYAIVDGEARVILRGGGSIVLGEGEVIGEACLLDEGQRQADVRAESRLMTLRIVKKDLEAVMIAHVEIEAALFELLARRLVSNLMQTSPLFSGFEPAQRLELAQMFEVRRAAAGTVLAQRGRRYDGLYVLLAGHVDTEGDAATMRIARGTTFGHSSLLGGEPAAVTMRASSESVVLRLPAARFTSLAAMYPPALAHLAETMSEGMRPSRYPQ